MFDSMPIGNHECIKLNVPVTDLSKKLEEVDERTKDA